MEIMKDEDIKMAKEKTIEEIRQEFLKYVAESCRSWNDVEGKDTLGKLEGLAFSILVAIDGESCAVPGFILAPHPHPEDKEYNQKRCQDWYPENHESNIKADIAGNLHHEFNKFRSDNLELKQCTRCSCMKNIEIKQEICGGCKIQIKEEETYENS